MSDFENKQPEQVEAKKTGQSPEELLTQAEKQDVKAGADDFESLLKYREDNREKILEEHGLNEYLVQSLLDQGITVEIAGAENEGYPHIDTSNVYHGVLDKNGNIISGMMSSIPVIGKYINSIERSSDGFTTFSVVDVDSGKLQKYIFSKDKWEGASNQTKSFYKKQLEE